MHTIFNLNLRVLTELCMQRFIVAHRYKLNYPIPILLRIYNNPRAASQPPFFFFFYSLILDKFEPIDFSLTL